MEKAAGEEDEATGRVVAEGGGGLGRGYPLVLYIRNSTVLGRLL